jgi:hypothetical protein
MAQIVPRVTDASSVAPTVRVRSLRPSPMGSTCGVFSSPVLAMVKEHENEDLNVDVATAFCIVERAKFQSEDLNLEGAL